jgi:hypothetical protein
VRRGARFWCVLVWESNSLARPIAYLVFTPRAVMPKPSLVCLRSSLYDSMLPSEQACIFVRGVGVNITQKLNMKFQSFRSTRNWKDHRNSIRVSRRTTGPKQSTESKKMPRTMLLQIFGAWNSNNQSLTLHSFLEIYAKLYTIYMSDLWWWNTWNSCETSLPTMRDDFRNMLRGRAHACTFMRPANNIPSALEKL